MTNYDQSENRGRLAQTLIEVLLAVSVITIAFLGIATLLSKSFFYHRVISDQLTATYLASEGVELAKNLIDHDHFAGNAWGSCFDTNPNWNASTNVGNFQFDYTVTDCAAIPAYSGATLYYGPSVDDGSVNAYGYTETAGATPTNFAREIRVTQNGNEITVNSIVNWSTGPVTSQSVNLEDHFYDWRQTP